MVISRIKKGHKEDKQGSNDGREKFGNKMDKQDKEYNQNSVLLNNLNAFWKIMLDLGTCINKLIYSTKI